MSKLSAWLKHTFGVPETRLDREAKTIANDQLKVYTAKAADALLQLAAELQGMKGIVQSTAIDLAHKKIESLGLPAYVVVLIGPYLDTVLLSNWRFQPEVAAAKEVTRISDQIRRARL
jgi:hypothetical protein